MSEKRLALVIGNASYFHIDPLSNPLQDAEAFAEQLEKLGFSVIKGLDLDLHGLGEIQSEFEAALEDRPDVALLYYAGHGLQVDGRNYLVPIDADITARAHLATRALAFDHILADMSEMAGASLVFLDACRDNPLVRRLSSGSSGRARSIQVRGGLARVDKVAGTFIAFATAPDQVAYDGSGPNSPFTGALLRHITRPGISVGDMMIDVRNDVLRDTDGRQEPWDQSSLRARFYFSEPESSPATNPRPLPQPLEKYVVAQTSVHETVQAYTKEKLKKERPW
ncbi:MAG: caspase domain-containing protein [Pseudomonadota bacterium]